VSAPPRIVAAALAAGHDGLAEVAIGVRYSNGATQSLNLPYDAVAPALDAAGVTDLDALIGLPWTALAPPAASPLSATLEGAP